MLKAFSDRSRDMADLVALLRLPSLEIEYIERWARTLDESIESDEVSQRLQSAVAKSGR